MAAVFVAVVVQRALSRTSKYVCDGLGIAEDVSRDLIASGLEPMVFL
jgi:hypothetical protein